MNFTNTKPYLPNTDNISLNTGKGLKVGKEIEKMRKEGEGAKGEGRREREEEKEKLQEV